ncbi:MAG: DUF2071 domain-containing protein [Nitriliruptor sp.]|nr:MAG: DUF2071 domain-containing protein [Nitriliruptor sp.]
MEPIAATAVPSPSVEPISREPLHPVTRPVMTMRWDRLSYLHWSVAPELVQAQLPVGLTADLHGGRAWVGLIPFVMGGIRAAGRVPLPQGTFPETNVRTYVVGPDGGRGIYFHSLDITHLAPTAVARGGYRLPYCWSRMHVSRRGEQMGYLARRRWPAPAGATSRVIVRVGARVPDPRISPLDDFLSARWALYAATPSGGLLRARVSHEPWPLREAELSVCQDAFTTAAGYDVADRPPDHVRYGGDVTVNVGPPQRVA